MLSLNNVTLVCIDDYNIQRAYQALRFCIKEITFNSVKLFTSEKDHISSYPIEKVIIHSINDKNQYSEFIIKELFNYINTEYVLIIQWDGFIVNHLAWNDKFFNYDYIGAPWKDDNVVGNGGFSLRSKKLLKLISELDYDKTNEDVFICRTNRDLLTKFGIKFAPVDIAYKFSIENEEYQGSFGWHGGNLPQGYERWLIKNKLISV